jgi:hypothetical protein
MLSGKVQALAHQNSRPSGASPYCPKAKTKNFNPKKVEMRKNCQQTVQQNFISPRRDTTIGELLAY